MKEGESVTKVYISKEEINKIVQILMEYKFSDLQKISHYSFSLGMKDTNEKEIEETFSRFDKIKMIMHRKRESGYNNHDLFYLKENGHYILYAVNLDKKPPELINAYVVERNFNNFMRHIIKQYKNKLF